MKTLLPADTDDVVQVKGLADLTGTKGACRGLLLIAPADCSKPTPMKRQLSVAGYERSQHQRATRRERFLAEMDRIIPWAPFVAVIAPHYVAGGRGRPPVGIKPLAHVRVNWIEL